MKTNNHIYSHWTIVLFMLLVWLPVRSMAQTKHFELVVEKTNGKELPFKITDKRPYIIEEQQDGINMLVISEEYSTTYIPCSEVKRLFTRIWIGKEGDANNDGTVNAADIVEVVNYIMNNPSEKFDEKSADANGDGVVNAADIVTIVNIIMGN